MDKTKFLFIFSYDLVITFWFVTIKIQVYIKIRSLLINM